MTCTQCFVSYGGKVEEYSVDRFYMHGVDKRGHLMQTRVAFPPDRMQQLHDLVQDDRYPYKNIQDIIRDAIVHRIAWLADNGCDAAEGMLKSWLLDHRVSAEIALQEAGDRLVANLRSLAESAHSVDEIDTVRLFAEDALKSDLRARHVRQVADILRWLPE